MIRVLLMIAVAGFVLSLAMISGAVAIGGPEVVGRGAWTWASHDGWNWDFDDDGDWGHHRHGHWADGSGPRTTREIAWSGGESLDVNVPADVQFTQAEGPAKLVVSGPKGAVEQVEVKDGRIGFANRIRHAGRLEITLTAPRVTRFELSGRNRLSISNYRQDVLDLDLSGSSEVTGVGQAKAIKLEISGSGDADLGKLPSESADIHISGSAEAIVAPSERAKVDISGSGDVTLLTHPKQLDTDVSGSGRIHQEAGGPTPTPSPPPPTTPSKKL
ncbi:MAG: DUF2807 domain-containing protein [Phenylobacterium sp.]